MINIDNATIYEDKTNIVHSTCAYEDESRVCERLLSMGYVASRGVNLTKRLTFLNREVERLWAIEKKRRN